MRKPFSLFLIVVFVVAGGALAHLPTTARANDMTEYDGCPVVDGADGVYSKIEFFPIAVFYAGDTIEISAEPLAIAPLGPSLEYYAPTIYLKIGGVQVDVVSLPGTLTYTFTEDTKLADFPALEWGLELPAAEAQLVPFNAKWTASCSNVPLAGCDVLMNIPSTAVVGAFVANAPLYWEPGQLVQPYTEITAGNTAWVLGKDASGEYYKIIWVCDQLWVPVGAMGPNYDAVWNGAPLPADVVE
ncbi:MAG: hypothetical protein KBH93_00620 [Anaerolineae bacterium]|nr:hypothetical protein [Anaerolineae bacterium]